MAVDLLLQQPAEGTDLLFGWYLEPPSAEATLDATLPSLIFLAKAIPNAEAALDATLPDLILTATGDYRSVTQRPLVGLQRENWQISVSSSSQFASHHQPAIPALVSFAADWDIAGRLGSPSALAWQVAQPIAPISHPLSYQGATREHSIDIACRHSDAQRARRSTAAAHQNAIHAGWMRWQAFHQDGLRDRRLIRLIPVDDAERIQISRKESIETGAECPFFLEGIYQTAMRPPPGVSTWGDGIQPPQVPCYFPNGNLLLEFAVPGCNLLLVCEKPGSTSGEKTIYVPIRRVYFVANNITLIRFVDSVEVPAFSLSLSLDTDSWTWGFDASLPASAESLVDPGNENGPVELVATINGTAFRVLAETISRDREFAKGTIRISGRGRMAALSEPYAPVMNFQNAQSRTAQQIMNDVLTHDGTPGGVPLGWTVNWELSDWTVPQGAFTHQGTWIEAINLIAAAAGGYLAPHPSDMSFRVRHRFPIPPWDWDIATPDYILPADVVTRENVSWVEKPAYNRVFVSGQEVGVLGQVTRSGTAGDLLAPMVVDALITQAAAARQRGIAILSDTGRQIEATLRLPVLDETGILLPGAFVEYQDGAVNRLGLVRSTRIDAGYPDLWQTIGVQSHV